MASTFSSILCEKGILGGDRRGYGGRVSIEFGKVFEKEIEKNIRMGNA
jgi:hypothetical protein